ncbi:MAG: efflux RND transporter periplasmic adaptor subunit [Sterolibacteriaceae bacterium]|uniref:Efflux RND transporter periplasmic adaptor subunit n=1 Tax=Candidatus Methylophosphatis roskildensis TaxID=2899263 RepID=A0A9D7DYV4_9PROT|nr:efflux RND transporter periplasmic adaptor subunit [Candidatus Methylophosphatis roskildensis]
MITPVQRWLNDYCDRCQTVSSAVVITSDAETQRLHPVAGWPANAPESLSLLAAARAAVQRAHPVLLIPPVSPSETEHARIVSLPLSSGDRTLGAVALALRSANDATAKDFLAHLKRSGGSLISALSERTDGGAGSVEAARLIQIQATLLGRSSLAEAATELANELATALHFDRVSIGLIEGGKASLLALSHSAEFQQGQSVPRQLVAAMEEAVDQRCTVVHPPLPGDKPRIVIAHTELALKAGTSLCTVPLINEGQVVGAVSFERPAGAAPAPAEVALCEHIACLVAPLLALRLRAERSPWARALELLKGSGGRRLKISAAAVALLLAALTFIPIDYRIGAPARIEGSIQRVLAAPMDGFVRKAHVRPGDTVRAGDLLVELLDQDLLLEQRRWESELAQHENAYTAAMVRADRAQFAVRQAKATEAQAQLDLVRSQLERSRVLAPLDGIVIKGDLTQAPGAPVKRGDVLLTLAPSGEFRLIIEVDERDIRDVREGAKGSLALSALPGETLPFAVDRVTPVAVGKDGSNAFEVEARLESSPQLLRPGMQGVAKIEAGRQSAGWVLTHRIVDWLRLAVWSWVG